MKTIQEKAERYIKNGWWKLNVGGWEARMKEAFVKGYSEATRWRDPKEELPEFNKNDYPNGDYKRYLIKVVRGSISKRRYVEVGWLISANRWNVEMDWVNVIGWRPIE